MSREIKLNLNAGLSSIVMVFAVLCLTIFAVLSLVTSNSEKKLTEQSAAAVERYYKADCLCQDVLGKICALDGQYTDAKEFKDKINALEDMPEDMSMQISADKLYISFSQRIDDKLSLQVAIACSHEGLEVKAWQMVRDGQWCIDDHIKVWDGQ